MMDDRFDEFSDDLPLPNRDGYRRPANVGGEDGAAGWSSALHLRQHWKLPGAEKIERIRRLATTHPNAGVRELCQMILSLLDQVEESIRQNKEFCEFIAARNGDLMGLHFEEASVVDIAVGK